MSLLFQNSRESGQSVTNKPETGAEKLTTRQESSEIDRQDADRRLWGRRFIVIWGWLYLLTFGIVLIGFSPEEEIFQSILPALIFSGILSVVVSFFLVATVAVIVRGYQGRIGPQEKATAVVFVMGALFFVPLGIYWDWAYLGLIAFMALFYRILVLIAREGRFFGKNINAKN